MHPRLTALAQEDRRVRIVFKDWAIFGAPSVEAARRALAAKYQGKDKEFDDALMQSQGKLSYEKIRVADAREGVDWQRLESVIQALSTEIKTEIAQTED